MKIRTIQRMMTFSVSRMNRYIHPIQQQLVTPAQKQPVKKDADTKFSDLLQKHYTDTDVKVSKHAKMRLSERNIYIDDAKWQQIGSKMTEAKQKGVTDALVILDDAALVVSTKNNTVVTALNQHEAENKIFTNINGTILI